MLTRLLLTGTACLLAAGCTSALPWNPPTRASTAIDGTYSGVAVQTKSAAQPYCQGTSAWAFAAPKLTVQNAVIATTLDDAPYAGRDDLVARGDALYAHPFFQNWGFELEGTSLAMEDVPPPLDGVLTDQEIDPLIRALALPEMCVRFRDRLRRQAWLLDHLGAARFLQFGGERGDQFVVERVDLVERDHHRLVVEPRAISGEFVADDAIAFRHVGIVRVD